MLYQEHKRGDLIIKHLDIPDKFYLILEGKCAVFKDRFADATVEQEALKKLMFYSGQKNLRLEDIKDIRSKESFTKEEKEGLDHFQEVEEGVVRYKYEFLKRMLNKFVKTEIPEESEVFRPDGVLFYSWIAEIPAGALFGELGLLES